MSTLHLVFDPGAADLCRTRRNADDATVLLGDGVYAHLEGAQKLADDLKLRGLESSTAISMQDLVALTVEHTKTITWHSS